jgi:exodeoxyribonuclease III
MRTLAVLSTLGSGLACGGPQAPLSNKTLRVLTFNVQVDGHDHLDEIAALIRRVDADVVFAQECHAEPCGAPLGRKLGLGHVQQGDDTATYSRWPLDASGHVMAPGGARIRLSNLHFYYKPYQPYQLLKIPYEDSRFISTEQEAIAEAHAARGDEVAAAIAALAGETMVIAGGDFNEPSHLDWTAAAAAAGRQPIKVEWPATKAFADAGFADAYRAVYPDPLTRPGFTWTPTTRSDDPADHHDRIDFLLVRGLRPLAAQIVGENEANADIVVSPYPSDHRGVVATFALP